MFDYFVFERKISLYHIAGFPATESDSPIPTHGFLPSLKIVQHRVFSNNIVPLTLRTIKKVQLLLWPIIVIMFEEKYQYVFTLSGRTLSGKSDKYFGLCQKLRPTNSFARHYFRRSITTKITIGRI